jgi:hypothetical protein
MERCDGNLSSTRMFVGHMLEHSLVGRQDMGNSKTMIMDGEIADEMGDSALPGLRSEFLNRRSFLFGSAVSLGALGLAGCATTDDMARAAKLYGPVPDKKFAIPAVDVSKIDPKYFRQTVRYDTKEGCRRGSGWNLIGVVSGFPNPNDSSVGALDRRLRHDEGYHEDGGYRRRHYAFRQLV